MKTLKKLLILSLALFINGALNAQEYAMNTVTTNNNVTQHETSESFVESLLNKKTFTYKYKGEDVEVIFDDEDHVEYFNNKKYFIKSKISWTSDGECSLTIKESNLPNFPFKKGTKLKMKVMKVKKGYVHYESTLGGRSWTGKMKENKRLK